MELTGKIYKINDVVVVSEKFKKREFVLEISNNPAYVEKVIFQLSQDKVTLADDYNQGDEVTVSINVKGREWTSPQGEVRFFNTLDVWKMSKNAQDSQEGTQGQESLSTPVNSNSADDDLPF